MAIDTPIPTEEISISFLLPTLSTVRTPIRDATICHVNNAAPENPTRQATKTKILLKDGRDVKCDCIYSAEFLEELSCRGEAVPVEKTVSAITEEVNKAAFSSHCKRFLNFLDRSSCSI